MKVLKDFREKAEIMQDSIKSVKMERMAKEKILGSKRQEKVQLVLGGLHGNAPERKIQAINSDISSLEKELVELTERIDLFESESKKVLAQYTESVKVERQKRLNEVNKEIEKAEEQLYQVKYEYLKKIKDFGQERAKLQAELNEYNESIGRVDERDRPAKVKDTFFVNRAWGHNYNVAVGVETREIETVVSGQLASLELYLLTGEIVKNESDASQKLKGSGQNVKN